MNSNRNPLVINGAPSKIRTCDIQIRSLALYPAEPWAQNMMIKIWGISNNILMKATQFFKNNWRRERDLNPRYTFKGRTIA